MNMSSVAAGFNTMLYVQDLHRRMLMTQTNLNLITKYFMDIQLGAFAVRLAT